MKTHKREFTFEKETKRTYRFQETPIPGEPMVLSQAYIPQWLVPDKNKTIKITIEISE